MVSLVHAHARLACKTYKVRPEGSHNDDVESAPLVGPMFYVTQAFTRTARSPLNDLMPIHPAGPNCAHHFAKAVAVLGDA